MHVYKDKTTTKYTNHTNKNRITPWIPPVIPRGWDFFNPSIPMDSFLAAMLLELRKEVIRLSEQVGETEIS